MIKTFRHKELERFFTTGSTRGVDSRLTGKLARLLAVLHTAETPEDMRAPAHRLHQLKGDRDGHWAVWVTGNLRLVFEFDGDDVLNVDLVDYH